MATEVFNRIGEGESFSEKPNFYRRKSEENNWFEKQNEIESTSNPITDAKKEFFKELEDDSLDIDTCGKLNHDWKKK